MKKQLSLFLATTLSLQLGAFSIANAETSLLYAEMDIFNEAGRYVTDLSGLSEISGSVTVTGEKTEAADVYVTVYDNGRLATVDKYELAADADSIDFTVSNLPGSENQTVKAFIWNEDLTPLSNDVDVWSVHTEGYYNYYGLNKGKYGAASDVTYQWYESDTEEGEYTSMNVASASVGGWGENKASKWIKFVVTSDGVNYESEPRQIHYNWRTARKAEVDFSNAAATSHDTDVFTVTDTREEGNVGDMEFVLLNVTESLGGRFMVVAKNAVGEAVSLDTAKYDIAEEGSLPRYLNSDTFKALLPDGVIKNYDNSNGLAYCTQGNYWYENSVNVTEGGYGITVPDINEVIEYQDKIGLSNDGKQWWTRSYYNSSSNGSALHTIDAEGNHLTNRKDSCYLRPMMYLNEDFFLNVKIDLDKAGANVKKAICDTYTKDEIMAAGYTEEELGASFDREGTLENPEIIGTVALNSELTASFDIFGFTSATDEEVLALTEYQWVVADTAGGAYTAISGANEKTFAITANQNGKYIKVMIYLPNGKSFETEPVYADLFDETFTGIIENQRVTGIYNAGNVLYFGYDSETVTDEDIVDYKWYKSTSEAGTYELAGTDASVATEDVDSIRYYKAIATLKNGVTYETPVVTISGRIANERKNYTFGADVVWGASDAAYKFSVEGHEFVLLDTVDTSDNARFKVVAEDTYGTNIDAAKAALPSAIKEYIAPSVWFHGSKNAWGGYKAGVLTDVYYPAIEDLIEANIFLGLSPVNHGGTSAVNWILRNNAAATADGGWQYIVNGSGNLMDMGKNAEIRPMFYLDKDFFCSKVFDLSAIGAEVVKTITEQYTREELEAAGYEPDVLDIYYEESGLIENLSITGNNGYDEVQIATFDYSGIDEESVKFSWLVANEADGTFVFAGGNEKTFTPTAEHNAKYIKVIAYTGNGISVESESKLVAVIDDDFTATIAEQSIRGILKGGNVLSLGYTSDTVTDEDIVAYTWSKASTVDGTYSVVGTDSTYITDTGSAYYKLQFMLKNGDVYETEPVYVEGEIVNKYQNYTFSDDVLWSESNEDYRFIVGGQEFVLLDVEENSDDARYMVLAESTYGTYPILQSGEWYDEINTDEFKALLPDAIRNHLAEKVYFNGTRNAWGDYIEGFLGSICIPSLEDLETYKSIIGLSPVNASGESLDPVQWWVRNNAALTSDGRIFYLVDGAEKLMSYAVRNEHNEIRPMFYLDKDFFVDENIEYMGSAVEEMIK